MPSLQQTWSKREVKAPAPELEGNTEPPVMEPPAGQEAVQETFQKAQADTLPTEMPLTSTEPGGEHFQKHIFGNKTYHPSHGRTTPFPEPGIS